MVLNRLSTLDEILEKAEETAGCASNWIHA